MFSAAKTAGPSGYNISRSVRLRSSASAYLNRTNASAGNLQKWTMSFWHKRGQLGNPSSADLMSCYTGISSNSELRFNTSDQLLYYFTNTTAAFVTNAVYRDPSAWYHIVLVWDSANATAALRCRLYVNGSEVTSMATDNRSSISSNNSGWNNTTNQLLFSGNSAYVDGYLTEINFIDGQALTPSSFGSTNAITGVWQPAKYTGTYGTNGFYLNFSDNSAATAAAIGKDYSGNGNNWTPNNISVTAGTTYDSMIDTPTPYADGGNGRGNYAVLNPLKNTASISNANLQTVNSASAGYYTSYATMAMDTGKYYWEITVVDDGVNARYLGIGVADPSIALTGSTTSAFTGTQAGNARGWTQTVRSAVSVYGTGLYNNSSTVNSTTRSTTSGTRVFMVAYDADTGKCWMGYEGTWWSGDPAAGTSQYFTASAPMVPVLNPYNDGSTGTFVTSANFGQRPFSYTPPTGFKALNTYNLPASTILNGGKYMAATTYTGTGASQSVTNAGSFKPDLVWIKSRSAATDHKLTDSVRGTTKALISDTTGAETTDTNGLTAFGSAGFTVGSDTTYNNNTATYVGWQWQAGQGTTSSNTSGSITSTVSVNQTAGFSIVTYTGTGANATVGHGLGVAPKMVIVKSRTTASGWAVYHGSIAATNYLLLESTAASTAGATVWNSTAPTSSVFSVGTDGSVNGSTRNYVAYCWAEIAGFSKFGSYTGNGSADGPFVYCGFLPRYVMIKRSDGGAEQWNVIDTARNPYNTTTYDLVPSSSGAETTSSALIDVTANGFKLRFAGTPLNTSSGTYIFAAFAENPFSAALAR